MTESNQLGSSQLKLVETGAEVRSLVLAGPGTGKTHALIRRLVYLVNVRGLSPYNEILVLSFTRAAVGEIRARVAALVEAQDGAGVMAYLNIMTFDSFATRLISAAEANIDLSGKSYDTRIEIATRVLDDPESESSRRLAGLKHVVVDEIQDLVGVRARMVQQILQRAEGGFTLFGDPAQAIYDYQVASPSDGPGAIEFLHWVQSTWAEELQNIEFFENHRVRTKAARVAERIRPLVLQTQQGNPAGYRSIRNLLIDLPSAGSFQAIDPSILKQPGGRKRAILCRTNAEVLLTAAALVAQNIPVAFPPRLEERGLPPWLARMFSRYLKPRIRKEQFEQRWAALLGENSDTSLGQAWGILKALDGRTNTILNVDDIKRKLRSGADWAFDSEMLQREDNVLVTTIHQSKGREFEDVIILPPEPRKVNRVQTALEEARVFYVASTRARDSLFRLKRDGLPAIERVRCRSGRRRYVGKQPGGPLWMEAGVPGDIMPLSPVDKTFLPESGLAEQLQEIIWERLNPGMRLEAHFAPRKGDPGFLLVVRLSESGKPIPVAAFDGNFAADVTDFLRGELGARGEYRRSYGHLLLLERFTGIIPPYSLNVYEPYIHSGLHLGLHARGMIRLL